MTKKKGIEKLKKFGMCPLCGEPVMQGDGKFMQAIDGHSYRNVWWHKSCWDIVKDGPQTIREWELEECVAAERGWD